MAEIRIEPFTKAKHDRSSFSCGQPSLDAFLRTLVTQYEKRRLGRTFVAARFYAKYGFVPLLNQPLHLYLPLATAALLPRHP